MNELNRKTFLSASAVGLTTVALTATASDAMNIAQKTSKVFVSSSSKKNLCAYLHTPGQEKSIFPGGWLQGRLDMAVIEPFFALNTEYGVNSYTLADIKKANPNTKIIAYFNPSMFRPSVTSYGVFNSTSDLNTAIRNNWVIPAGNLDVGVTQEYNGKKYARYSDYSGTMLADISKSEVVDAIYNACTKILSTASHSTNGAPDAYFDGIMFDDVNMGPQHALNEELNKGKTIGAWQTVNDYADDMRYAIDTVGQRLRWDNKNVVLGANLGASPWIQSEYNQAMKLIQVYTNQGTKPLLDYVVREFSTSWTDGLDELSADQIALTCQYAHDTNRWKSKLFLHDFAPVPGTDANHHTPSMNDRSRWNRKQRMLAGMGILTGNPVAAMTVPSGRNQYWDKSFAENMDAPVANLDDPIVQRLAQNADSPSWKRTGDVLYRSGQVYVNAGYKDATVEGHRIPARDAIIV